MTWWFWTVSIIHLIFFLLLIFPLGIKDTGTKAVWLAGKVVGAAEMAEECRAVLHWAPLLDNPPKCFHVPGCHQHEERYRTYDQSGHYGGFGQGASCQSFLKIETNFSCCDIARQLDLENQCFHVSCSEGQAEILCCTCFSH